MITGELKSKIDKIWDAFWSGGISNPLEVVEQITHLLFVRRLDVDVKSSRSPLAVPSIAAVLVLALAACGSGDRQGSSTDESAPSKVESTASPDETPTTTTPEPTQEPSPSATEPAEPTLTIECLDPNDLDSVVAFTIDRSNPDFSEAWSTPIPVDKKLGFSMCSEVKTGDYGGGPALTPVSAVEQTIWNSAKGSSIYKRQRSTLTDVYVQCVEHDTPDLLKDYPSAPNLVDEARTMLLMCPGHPNAAAMRKRIVVQAGFGQQIVNGETIRDDGTFVVGSEVEPGTYRTFTAGGVFPCIWSRYNASDRPIAHGGAKQGRAHEITVTIAPSDHSFYTEGCGVWFRLP